MSKRYYWLKLKTNWFSDKRIKKLRSIAGGDTYVVIYLKMMLLSLNDEGKLYFEGVEEDFASELALELDEDVENIKVTLSFLQKNGLMELCEEDEYLLNEVPESIGSESRSAEKMRKFRAAQNSQIPDKKGSHCDHDVTKSDGNVTESDIEKEIEKEKRDRNTSVPSPGGQTSEPEADVAAIVLKDGMEWRPTKALFAEYVRLYPNVDVEQQFNEMRGWCLSNPEKRKTRRGVKRFVNGWLSREQERHRQKTCGNGKCQQASASRYGNRLAELENEDGGGY